MRSLCVALACAGLVSSLDMASEDCHACDALSDKECLAVLDASLAALPDKNRLKFLREIFTGSFQVAAHLPQSNADSTVTCLTLSDKDCLAALDAQVADLPDKYRLSYLVASCNMLQHWSAFSASSSRGSAAAAADKRTFSGLALGVGVVGIAAFTTTMIARRRRKGEYTLLDDLELEEVNA